MQRDSEFYRSDVNVVYDLLNISTKRLCTLGIFCGTLDLLIITGQQKNFMFEYKSVTYMFTWILMSHMSNINKGLLFVSMKLCSSC